MTINLTFAIILLVLSFFVIPTILLLTCYKKKALKYLSAFFFLIYFVFIMVLVLGQIGFSNNTITLLLQPNSPWFTLRFLVASFEVKNILYNLIMMFPVAFFVFGFTSKKVFYKTIVISFCFSLFIETCQFVLPFARYTELLDVFVNTLSGVLGYLYFRSVVCVFYKLQSKNKAEEKKRPKK